MLPCPSLYCLLRQVIIKRLAILTVACTLGFTGSALASTSKEYKQHYTILPNATNWIWATGVAERVFPNTKEWLLKCSSREGGHGRWVWNTQGSGSGGWMQFLEDTFNSYVWAAYGEVLKRGFRLKAPTKVMLYMSPLGQALTAAYMRTIGISHIHWDPRIDYNCY